MFPFPKLSHRSLGRDSPRALKIVMSLPLMIMGLSSECFGTFRSGKLVCLCIITKVLIGIMVRFYAINLLLTVACQKALHTVKSTEAGMFPALRNWEFRKHR